MPTPVNLIDSLQQKYDAIGTFTGKPANLWFGDIFPTKSGGAVDYPFIRFLHTGTPTDTDFEYNALEEWGFRFEIYAQTAQLCTTIFDRVRFDGLAPNVDPSTPRTGFWYPTTVDMPAGYVFKSLIPVGQFTLEVRSGQFSPSGTPIHVLTFDMRLQAHRVTFS